MARRNIGRAFPAMLAAGGMVLALCGGAADEGAQSKPRPAAKEAAGTEPHQADAPKKTERGGGEFIPIIDPAAALREARQAEPVLRRAMQAEVTSEFKETPLKEIISRFAKQAKVPLAIDAAALNEEGIDTREPISARIEDISVEQALERILRPLSLTWLIENEVVLITTVTRAEEKLFAREYDVKRLLAATKDERTARAEQSIGFFQYGGGYGGGGYGGALPAPPIGPDEWLIQVIQEMTSGPWQQIDGAGGTISLAGRVLVVRQTRQVHDEIAGLLRTFDWALDGRLKGRAVSARPATYPHRADAAIRRALTRRIDIALKNTPLRAAAAELGSRAGITVLVDESALSEEGIASSEPINLDLAGVTVGSAFRLMLRPLGLAAVIENAALYLTTITSAEEMQQVVVYDVRDLLQNGVEADELAGTIQTHTSGPWMDIDGTGGTISVVEALGALIVRQTQQVHAEIALLLDGLRKHSGDAAAEKEKRKLSADEEQKTVVAFYPFFDPQRAEALAKTLVEFVAPESWKQKGGQAGVSVVGATLVVRQSVAGHKKISDFLRRLLDAEQLGFESFGYRGPAGGYGGSTGGLGGGIGGGAGGAGFFSVSGR